MFEPHFNTWNKNTKTHIIQGNLVIKTSYFFYFKDKRMVVKKLAKLNIIKSKEIVQNLTQSIEINDSVAIDIN